jgi:hypothetical protein
MGRSMKPSPLFPISSVLQGLAGGGKKGGRMVLMTDEMGLALLDRAITESGYRPFYVTCL